MSPYGKYTEEEKRRIKRRRGVRISISFILALAAAALLYPVAITTDQMLQLPIWRRAAILVLMILSIAIGWKPNYETWFGDQEIYVDEPEIDSEKD